MSTGQTNLLYTFTTPYIGMAGESLEVYPDRLRYHQYSGLFERSYEDIRIKSIEQIRLAEGVGRFYGVGDLQIRTQGILPVFIRIQKLKYAAVARDFILSLQHSQPYDLDAAIAIARTARRRALSTTIVVACVAFLIGGWAAVAIITGRISTSTNAVAAVPAEIPVVTKQSPSTAEDAIPATVVATVSPTPTIVSSPTQPSPQGVWHCGQRYIGSQWQYFTEHNVEKRLGLTWQQFGVLLAQQNPPMFGRRGNGKEAGVFYVDEEYCLPNFHLD